MSMNMTSMSIGSMSMDECLDLPPGFRFHPTDEELITSYLSPKVANPAAFAATAIGEVDLNKCEPWDLPSKAKMGEKEWYFFCQRDRKYPTGMRTNRATEAGYWKATGKDKEIYAAAKGRRLLVGMKKTLVFYRGRAPKGDKSNWVMHEYRLESRSSSSSSSSTLSPKDEWVVCRVFHKSGGNGGGGGGGGGGAKKTPMPGGGMDQYAALPPLTDYHYYYNAEDFEEATNATAANPSPSSYFSSMMAGMVEDFSGGMVDPTPVPASAMPPPPQSFGFQDPFSSAGAAGAGYLHRQDYYYDTPAPAMRQCKAEEVANNQSVVVSEDTGASTDRNTEISSVVSRQHDAFELDDLVSGGVAEPSLDLDGMWRC